MNILQSLLLTSLLLLLGTSACSLLGQDDENCPITAVPLTLDDFSLTQDVVYHNTISGDLYYTAGECFGGSGELIWEYSGEVYEITGRSYEVLTDGEMCVSLSSGGQQTDPLCKQVTVHRDHTWATHYLDFPGGKTKQSVIMNVAGDIYSGFGMYNNWYRFDTTSFRWEQMAAIPNLVDFNAFAGFSIDDKGYIVGNNSVLYEYDPMTNNWTNKGQLPDLVTTILNLGSFGNRAEYDRPVLGVSEAGKGYFGIGVLEHLYEYDPHTNKWTQLADRPERGKVGEHQFVYKGKIYSGKYEYDIATDTWQVGNDNFSVDAGFSPGFVLFKGAMYGGLAGKTVKFDGESITEIELEGAEMFTQAPIGLYGNGGASSGQFIVFSRLMGILGKDEVLWKYYIND